MYQAVRRAIGQRLREARLASKFTQQDVAEDFARSRQAVSSWEQGKTLPDLLEFSELATLYGVSADDMLFGVNVKQARSVIIARAAMPDFCDTKSD